VGEFELLARIRERLPADGQQIHLGSGDDAAIALPDGVTATSVDALVEGVHFSRETATPAQIGHKALAAALSDLAAMGAGPGEAYVALGLPIDFDEDECVELLDGMSALAAATGTSLAGGDLTRAPALFLAVTVVGRAPQPEALVSRAGARSGDLLVLSGEIGAAAAGLRATDREPLRSRQLEPVPRLGAGQALARNGATAMIDVSDGLGADAGHVAESSSVRLRIDAAAVPLAPAARELSEEEGRDPWWLLGGGEDSELLAALPPQRLEDAAAAVLEAEGIALTPIGSVAEGAGVEIRLPDGRVLAPAGFDQLA
jgi:thiamine-monophosphate kinase